ncbi:FxLD family lanthipeptide [Streptomyces sp. NPDC052299]|uniref:FxLD family lanthipeptide n=1 Tax=Streptomyces sp. NPDC052299 TaxID=3155054 RepID=UPI00342D4A5D
MAPRASDQSAKTVPAFAAQDPFDLDISVVVSGGTVTASAASAGGCAATCGSSACVSSGS